MGKNLQCGKRRRLFVVCMSTGEKGRNEFEPRTFLASISHPCRGILAFPFIRSLHQFFASCHQTSLTRLLNCENIFCIFITYIKCFVSASNHFLININKLYSVIEFYVLLTSLILLHSDLYFIKQRKWACDVVTRIKRKTSVIFEKYCNEKKFIPSRWRKTRKITLTFPLCDLLFHSSRDDN